MKPVFRSALLRLLTFAGADDDVRLEDAPGGGVWSDAEEKKCLRLTANQTFTVRKGYRADTAPEAAKERPPALQGRREDVKKKHSRAQVTAGRHLHD